MNTQPTVFAQIMAFLPLHEFRKCVRRYHGDYKVRKFWIGGIWTSPGFTPFINTERFSSSGPSPISSRAESTRRPSIKPWT
ncbi:MAG TPA: hypothetical protein DIW61_07005 [Candidatus Aminicenantes bacterium]|nr:hypothetical protein [Candidatus Aminicenantes bacterium]